MRELKRYFDAADGRRSFWETQRRLFAKQRAEAERREKLEDDAEDALSGFAAGAMVATDLQIEQFATKLDTYETATVDALMANEKAMELIQAQLDGYLERAHVVEDGRRVFKTRDGTQVFDEFGEEVGPEIVAPDEIDDSHPRWEEYAPLLEESRRLEAERADILDYQEKLDEARDAIAEGDITTEELESLDAELTEIMPPAVRAKSLDGGGPVQHPEPSSQAGRPDPAADRAASPGDTGPGF